LCLVDGLKGFPDAITAVFPQAMVQTGVVHLLRHSFDFVSWKGSEKQWIMPPREWSMAKARFAVLFGERFTLAMT